jgi:transcriptional regulator with XRE-family HTH domain
MERGKIRPKIVKHSEKEVFIMIISLRKFVNNLALIIMIKQAIMTSLRALLAHNMKEQRRTLGITQVQLAEKVQTSTHYIGQIELGNKFPTPEMLERIAAALEIDSPQLFSMNSFPVEAIKQFQEGLLSDVETAVISAISSRIADFQKMC